MHDLLANQKDQDIANRINKEAAGGYDLKEARTALKFDNEKPSSQNIKARKEVEFATKSKIAAQNNLEAIAHEEMELIRLERLKQEAVNSATEKLHIKSALDLLEKKADLENAQHDLKVFDPDFSKLSGNEWSILESLNNRINSEKNNIIEAKSKYHNAKNELIEIRLPLGGIQAEICTKLERYLSKLIDFSNQIQEIQLELDANKTALKTALKDADPDLAIEKAKSIEPATISNIFSFIVQFENCQLESEKFRKLIDWLQHNKSGTKPTQCIQEGIALLREWLTQQKPKISKKNTMSIWIFSGIFVALFSITMSFIHISWILLLIPGLLIGFCPFLSRFFKAHIRGEVEADEKWESLGFEPLKEWSSASVRNELRNLESELAKTNLQNEKNILLKSLKQDNDALQTKMSSLVAESKNWHELLGITIIGENARLYIIADQIQRIQESLSKISVSENQLSLVKTNFDKFLNQINEDLQKCGLNQANDECEASAYVDDLKKRLVVYNKAISDLKQAKRETERSQEIINKIEKEVADFFSSLGLKKGENQILRKRLDDLSKYTETKNRHYHAFQNYSQAKRGFKGNLDLLEEGESILRERFFKLENIDTELSNLDQQIGEIRGKVNRSKKETKLEEALFLLENRLDDLRANRDCDYARISGTILVNHLFQQQKEIQLPSILDRSIKLFSRITHGQYRLRITSGESSQFCAYDTLLEREQSLEELSSGTRVQLLLAVRLAFIESQENGWKFPLILDETLGNSDERRAKEIIESAIEIARDGRQIFYFTAQNDELGKWRNAIRGSSELKHSEFDLAKIRNLSPGDRAPEVIFNEGPSRLPVPEPLPGEKWESYGKRINVPPLNKWSKGGDIHLWYLIDDLPILWKLINTDITRWGPLCELVELGIFSEFNSESLIYKRANAAAMVFERLFEYWREGRGKVVETSTIIESNCISPAFHESVVDICSKCNGRGDEIIRRLKSNEVKRLRKDNIDNLEIYLKSNGFIDDRKNLSLLEIKERIVPFVFNLINSGFLTRDRLDSFLCFLFANEKLTE